MGVFQFIKIIFNKFPKLVAFNTILFVLTSIAGTVTVIFIAPIIDIIIHPDFNNISPLTEKMIILSNYIGIAPTFINWAIAFTVFVFISSLAQVLGRYYIFRICYAMLRNILTTAFEDFFNASWLFFSGQRQGDLINSFIKELNIIGSSFQTLGIFFSSIFQFVFLIWIPFAISWKVSLCSMIVSIVFLLPFVALASKSYQVGNKRTRTGNWFSSIIQENILMAKIYLGFGNQKKALKLLDSSFSENAQHEINSYLLADMSNMLYKPFAVIVVVVALYFSKKFNIALSEVAVLVLGLFQSAMALNRVITYRNGFANAMPSYEQIEKLRAKAKEFRQISGQKQFPGFEREIALKKVNFSYPSQPNVLNDVNISIEKGKMTALVGRSGSGKTTLMDIIMGLHWPQDGSIYVDDVPLSEYDIVSFRKTIGYVPQESLLFNATIKENLLWIKSDATEQDMWEACKLSHADEFIIQFPKKLETVVGDRGVRLSGGQIQRIALARALLRHPDILVLDEATSALDTHSEKMIQEALVQLSSKITILMIAHRLSTIKMADKIYVVDNGMIAESGDYDSLMANKGLFYSMVKAQELNLTDSEARQTDNIK
jgi:ABC-type multidrug transport system fused ATPase/permease subunit